MEYTLHIVFFTFDLLTQHNKFKFKWRYDRSGNIAV